MDRREFLQACCATVLMAQGVEGTALAAELTGAGDGAVKDHLQRSRDPDHHYTNDIFIAPAQRPMLLQLQRRLERLQQTVGHANFSLLGFDEMRTYGRNYSRVGKFTREEESLLEELFYADATRYGFDGKKPLAALTSTIERRALKRHPGSGQFIFKGEAERLYGKICGQLGDTVVLTSGVRGVVKQLYLFLTKAVANEGNLSLASRSLAPPGYSFHGVGDFDVGKRGWGARNFTAEFAATDEFKRLQELGFVLMRYPQDNHFGVRYEPWHIKVIGT